jgi:hypothetical protein
LNEKKALEGPGGGENASKQKEDAFEKGRVLKDYSSTIDAVVREKFWGWVDLESPNDLYHLARVFGCLNVPEGWHGCWKVLAGHVRTRGWCWVVLGGWNNVCGCARTNYGKGMALECTPQLPGQLGFEKRPSSSIMTGHRYDNGLSKAFDDDATVDKDDRITLVSNTRIVYPGTMFRDGINACLWERDGCDRCLDT